MNFQIKIEKLTNNSVSVRIYSDTCAKITFRFPKLFNKNHEAIELLENFGTFELNNSAQVVHFRPSHGNLPSNLNSFTVILREYCTNKQYAVNLPIPSGAPDFKEMPFLS